MRSKLSVIPVVVSVVLSLWAPVSGASENFAESQQGQVGPRPVVAYATRSDTTVALRRMPQIPPRPAVLGEIFETRPPKLLPGRQGSSGPSGPDPVLQGPVPGVSAPTTGANFEGVNNVNGVLPPDTVGDIGPNHYVQMVNLSFAIWDRNGNKLYGPVDNNTLWQGFGGPCAATNDGDPIVLYDHLADRWMMSQFALPRFPRGPFYQCIAVSQTGDPLGAWHRYEFKISDSKLNDYPKFGVWPDGYYMGVNQFTCNFVSCNWAGQGVVVFERDQMLNGQPARMVYFDLFNVDSNLGGMLPSDLDGSPPPSGAPNVFSQVDDNAWGYSPDQLQLWELRVNWTNPASSTFTHAASLGTAAFDSNMCGYSRNCIPQPGGTNVDAISDRLMYRLQYRNFGSHQTLVVNHTVDVNGSNRAGIRWYELRNTGGGWGLYQTGTYSPDSHHRWMASMAMNGAGDIALGFSVSSSSAYPSIRATGRLDGDSLGQMTQGEVEIATGSGYQTHSAGRWGDYSMMAVDPVDDCTFWYTQEYYAVVGSAPWQTRVGSFKLRDCGPANNPPTVSIVNPAEGSTVVGTVTVQIGATDTEDAAGTLTVEWNVDGGAWQPATYNSISGYYEASWNTTGVGDGSHMLNARATDSGGKTGTDSNAVTVDNVNDPPVASFTYSCGGLTCNFDASGSSDPDGTITSYAWDFGDGTAGSGTTASHTYAAAGTYNVTLTVTDDDGATDAHTQGVMVSDGAITLTANGYKVRGLQKADLTWSGATSPNVDIYRNNALIATTENDGFYTDNINNRGGGSYTYKVCEAGTSICSNEATVTF
ncbi:MAG TPA: PKD domain-containing protein [Anaerolineae bacterium]|nr:PKD domain-containing protein [Anaerolineae bacterium]